MSDEKELTDDEIRRHEREFAKCEQGEWFAWSGPGEKGYCDISTDLDQGYLIGFCYQPDAEENRTAIIMLHNEWPRYVAEIRKLRPLLAAKDEQIARRTNQYEAEVAHHRADYNALVRAVVEFGLYSEDEARSMGSVFLLGALRDEIRKLRIWKAGSDRLDKSNRELIAKLQGEVAALKAAASLTKESESPITENLPRL
jgi:hypothetical protein